MLLKYGDYSHPAGETEITVRRESLFSPTGIREGRLERWSIRGRLSGSTPAELTAVLQAFEAAHSRDGLDLSLRLADGTTASAHELANHRTLSGVRVARLSYPEGRGAEYATYRTYEVAYEAELPAEISPGLLAWDETLSVSGGGPRFEYVTCVLGPPVRVTVAEQTPFHGTQSGTAVGYATWPEFPSPLFPQAEHRDRRHQEKLTPRYTASGRTRYRIRWHYEFESSAPLSGEPTGLERR